MAKFVIYQDDSGENQSWRWRLLDNNGAKIAKSEEPFLSKGNALDSIEIICKNVDSCTLIVPKGDPQDGSANTRFSYFTGKDEQYYWELQNKGNNETLAVGGEGFSSKQSVITSIENVRSEIANNPEVEK